MYGTCGTLLPKNGEISNGYDIQELAAVITPEILLK